VERGASFEFLAGELAMVTLFLALACSPRIQHMRSNPRSSSAVAKARLCWHRRIAKIFLASQMRIEVESVTFDEVKLVFVENCLIECR
jgi:hypothetical protein